MSAICDVQRHLTVVESPRVLYALRRADDALILGHRLSEWCGYAPMLEEDMALANIGLDLIGQARALYACAAEIEGAGNDEDGYAFLRDAPQFRNLLLVELPNGDFACTIMRQFLYAAFVVPYWRAMTACAEPVFSDIAVKAEKECAYHLRHAAEWTIRLGDGTAESHRRAQDALDLLWPYTGEMFEADAMERGLIGDGLVADPDVLRPIWQSTLVSVLQEATLAMPSVTWMQSGGRSGRHTEHLGHLLSVMQHLPRSYPGATW